MDENRNSRPEKTSIDRKRHGKHVSLITNDRATKEELLDAMFSMRPVLKLYKENQREFSQSVVHTLDERSSIFIRDKPIFS
jgi:hypothetical protein